MSNLKIIYIAIFVLMALPGISQGIKNGIDKTYEGMPYILSTPEGYSAEKQYPTLLFLHGGDRSNTKHHPSKYAEKAGIDFPFIVIAPSCTNTCSWSDVDLRGLLAEATKEVSIDPKRIYLTGYSMGGAGTWANLKKIPGLLAAAAPLAPAGGSSTGLCKAKELAIRVYHGTADYGYNNSKKMVSMLRECGAKEVELISLKGKGHGIWPGIFSDPSFYAWLLLHQLEN